MKFLVQILYDDGSIEINTCRPREIIEMFGFRDCTGAEYEVYDASEFGKIVKLDYVPSVSAPFNFHRFINSETGDVAIAGYSTEH